MRAGKSHALETCLGVPQSNCFLILGTSKAEWCVCRFVANAAVCRCGRAVRSDDQGPAPLRRRAVGCARWKTSSSLSPPCSLRCLPSLSLPWSSSLWRVSCRCAPSWLARGGGLCLCGVLHLHAGSSVERFAGTLKARSLGRAAVLEDTSPETCGLGGLPSHMLCMCVRRALSASERLCMICLCAGACPVRMEVDAVHEVRSRIFFLKAFTKFPHRQNDQNNSPE